MNGRHPSLSPEQIDAAASDWIIRRDAGLSAVEQKAFSSWQSEHPDHAAAVARHEQAWSLLDKPRTFGAANLMQHALARRSARRTQRRVAMASAALLFVVSGLFWFRTGTHPEPTPASSALVLSPQRQTLPDGTQVELRKGALIAVDFAGPLRRVSLQSGEALFHVAKDPDRPFIVSAAGVEVRAVGTAFFVGVGETLVDVIVTEGSVAVERASAQIESPAEARESTAPVTPPPSTLVDAGCRLTVDLVPGQPSGRPVEISSAEIADRLSWRATRLEFSYTPLAEAIALMNQHSQVRLAIDDPELATLPVNGLFRADNTETLLRLLEANFDVTSTRSGNVITLRRSSK